MAENKDAPNPQTDKDADADAGKLALTQDELDAKIADAVKAAVKADRKERQKAQKQKQKQQEEANADDGDADEDDDAEDPAEIAAKAETRAARAEQERDQAVKEALLAKVENKLRDYLALNLREFIGNAPDIMLHIERALPAGAKEQEIQRTIESHAKAFAERTKAVRKPASGAPMGGARSPRASGFTGGGGEEEPVRRPAAASGNRAEAPSSRPFSHLNWQ